MGEYFLGLDIGTSSVKAVLFDEGGFALAGRSVECALETGADGGRTWTRRRFSGRYYNV